jgi:hypothetical protein
MCLEIKLGLDVEIDLSSKNSWLETFTLKTAESVPPLSRPYVYRIASRDLGCACLLMDDEGYEMDPDSSMTFHSARKDLARLLRGWVVRGPVEILAHWLGEEPLPAAPLRVSVNRLIRNPASFRCSGTPYYYLVEARPARLQ